MLLREVVKWLWIITYDNIHNNISEFWLAKSSAIQDNTVQWKANKNLNWIIFFWRCISFMFMYITNW